MSYTYTDWAMTADGGRARDAADIDIPEYQVPIPLAAWRIERGYNNDFPFNRLMPGIPNQPPANPVKQNEYICIFDYHTKQNEFDTHGLGILCPTSCKITEELNGNYELDMEHPIDPEGRWEWIQENNIIKALGQLFTIKYVQTTFRGSVGKIKVKAVHIFYQLNDWWIRRGAHLIGANVQQLMASAASFTEKHIEPGFTSYTFHFVSDVESPSTAISYSKWADLESGMTPNEFLLGNDGIISHCGGELYRDNFNFSINQRKENTKDNAFEIRIGKNLKGIDRIVDLSSMVTYFQGYDNWGNWFAISWDYNISHFNVPHHTTRSKNYNYTFDDTYFQTVSFQEQAAELLASDVTREFKANCSPVISYTVDLEEVKTNPDYADLSGFSEYVVGNTGYIYDDRLHERIGLKITRTVTDAITGKVETVIFGDKRSLVSHGNYNSTIIDLDPIPIAATFQITDSSDALVFDLNGAAIIQEEEV
jgi:phage-related protein